MRTAFAFVALLALTTGSAIADDDPVVGEWHILSTFRGQEMVSRFTIERGEDGALSGTYVDSGGKATTLTNVAFENGTLTFSRGMGQRSIPFEGTIDEGRIDGQHRLGRRVITAVGFCDKDAFDAFLAERRKANERGTDLEADYDEHARRALARDAFPVLFDPKLVPADEAEGIRDDEPVIGVFLGGEAKAYPISIMGVHELANDTCGGQPIAASW